MRKYALVAGAAVAVAAVALALLDDSVPQDRSQVVFHARLADPALYEDGLFTAQARVEQGTYEFRFVPNGDSPRLLSIAILDSGILLFTEDFELESTEQGSEAARYYTWDYLGQKQVTFLEDYNATFRIDPHGDVFGPVSVQLVVP